MGGVGSVKGTDASALEGWCCVPPYFFSVSSGGRRSYPERLALTGASPVLGNGLGAVDLSADTREPEEAVTAPVCPQGTKPPASLSGLLWAEGE